MVVTISMFTVRGDDMRVAFADDHALIREGLRPHLAQLAPHVELLEAETFGGVIQRVESARGEVDLCVLDLRMPDMDPMAGLEAVSACSPTMKIAVLSSISDPRTIRETIGRGVHGYIPKRLSAAAIVSALRLVLAGETFIPSIVLTHREGRGADVVDRLTNKERKVMALLREGMSNKAIARHLNISDVTVKTHLTHAFRKLSVQNRLQAAQIWQRQVE